MLPDRWRRVLRKDCAVKNRFLPFGFALLLLLTPSLATAFAGDPDVTPLNNKDVLSMVQSHVSEESIIKTIKSSACTFDTFPPVLRDMKRRGVPDAVLQAMIEAPYGPSERVQNVKDDVGEQPIYHYADQLQKMGYIAPTTSRQTQFQRMNVRTRTRARS
jgi:hypothetical protein